MFNFKVRLFFCLYSFLLVFTRGGMVLCPIFPLVGGAGPHLSALSNKPSPDRRSVVLLVKKPKGLLDARTHDVQRHKMGTWVAVFRLARQGYLIKVNQYKTGSKRVRTPPKSPDAGSALALPSQRGTALIMYVCLNAICRVPRLSTKLTIFRSSSIQKIPALTSHRTHM